MRLIVLDTNVLVSAGIKPGRPPATLVMDWILTGQVQVVTCPWIVSEYREVIRRPKFHRNGFPPLWVEFLIGESLHLPDPACWTHPVPDPKDAPFLALAQASGAWLVTGNLKHFPEEARFGVTAIGPGEYLGQLSA
jgi:putative PIN family toxin of toxin-antitoxin system